MKKIVFFNMHSFFKLYLVLFLCLTTCVSKEKEIKKADLHYQMALSLVKRCQYPQALAELQKAIELKKDDPLLYHSLALMYFQFEKYDKTVQYLQKTLKLDPTFTDARLHLGRSLVEMGQWKQGMAELDKAKQDLTYGYSENIHIHVGVAHYKKKNFSEAEKHFDVARKVKKKDCSIALYQAKSLYFQGQFKKALVILEPAKQWCEKNLSLCSSPSFDSYFLAALAYDKLGQRQNAFVNLKIFLDKVEKDNKYLKEARKKMSQWKSLNF